MLDSNEWVFCKYYVDCNNCIVYLNYACKYIILFNVPTYFYTYKYIKLAVLKTNQYSF